MNIRKCEGMCGYLPNLMELLDELDARKGVEVLRVPLERPMGENMKLSILAFVYDEDA